jgi:hypothetical protein
VHWTEQVALFVIANCTGGGVVARTKPERQPRGIPPVSTVNPIHAVRGGVSLLALPALALLVLVPLVGIGLWGAALWLDAVNWLPVLITCCGAGLVYMLLEHTAARMRTERIRAAATTLWVTVTWTLLVMAGPNPGLLLLTLTTGVFLVMWWFLVKTEPVRGIGQDGGVVKDAVNSILGLAEGTGWRVKDQDEQKLVVDVEHEHNTHDQVQKALPMVESISKGVKGGWRWAPGTKNGRPVAWKSVLTYWRADTLSKSIMWTGPDKPGAGVWEPIEYGVCEDGKPAVKMLTPTDDYVGSNAEIVMGTTGSAKTAYVLDLVGTLVARQGVVLWGADTEKAGQWMPLVRPAFDWFTTDVHELRHMLNALRAIVSLRTAIIMALTGKDRWTPECWTKHKIPAIVVIIEEAQPVLGDLEEEFKTGAQIWRSAGVYVVISLQRASDSNMDTDIRNLISEHVCFRVGKDRDAEFVLSPGTIDAGACPWALALKGDEGIHWVESAAEEQDRWPIRRRTFQPDRDELAWTIAQYAHRDDWHNLDDATLRAAYDSTKGRYASRQVIGPAEWRQSTWGKAPQLNAPRIVELLAQRPSTVPRPRPLHEEELEPAMAAATTAAAATAAAAPTPTPPAGGWPPEPPVPGSRETGGDDDDEDEPADDEPDDEPSEQEEEEVAVHVDRITDEIDDTVNREFGPGQDPPAPDPDDVVAAARSGIRPAGFDYSTPQPDVPPPSAEQRTANFKTMIRELFERARKEDAEDKELLQATYDPDRKEWRLRVGADVLVERWLQFPGERPPLRPAMYRVMTKFARQGWVIDAGQGRWLITERVLDAPLEFTDDGTDEEDVHAEEATLRDELGMDAGG